MKLKYITKEKCRIILGVIILLVVLIMIPNRYKKVSKEKEKLRCYVGENDEFQQSFIHPWLRKLEP